MRDSTLEDKQTILFDLRGIIEKICEIIPQIKKKGGSAIGL